jgi:hypothetical protein
VPGYGHEIGVAIPAGDNVKVQMIIDAGAGDATHIHADVETVGRHRLLQSPRRGLQQRHHLLNFRRVQILNGGLMAIRHDHQMAVVVGYCS